MPLMLPLTFFAFGAIIGLVTAFVAFKGWKNTAEKP